MLLLRFTYERRTAKDIDCLSFASLWKGLSEEKTKWMYISSQEKNLNGTGQILFWTISPFHATLSL